MRTGLTPGETVSDERVSSISVVESAQVLGLQVRDWCGLVPGRKEES